MHFGLVGPRLPAGDRIEMQEGPQIRRLRADRPPVEPHAQRVTLAGRFLGQVVAEQFDAVGEAGVYRVLHREGRIHR